MSKRSRNKTNSRAKNIISFIFIAEDFSQIAIFYSREGAKIGDADYPSKARLDQCQAWCDADPLDMNTWPKPELPMPYSWPMPDPLHYLTGKPEEYKAQDYLPDPIEERMIASWSEQ